MARDLLDYVLLDRAISYGDIGLLEDLLPRLLFRYIGGGSSNYSIEILELLQGLCREWPTDLKCVFSDSFTSHADPSKGLHPPELLASEHNRDAKMFSTHRSLARTQCARYQGRFWHHVPLYLILGCSTRLLPRAQTSAGTI